MAPRPYWKGYLKLSLVACPVVLYPATTQAEKTRFHMINKQTGNRLQQQMIDAETGEVVEKDDKGRGYQLGKGTLCRDGRRRARRDQNREHAYDRDRQFRPEG